MRYNCPRLLVRIGIADAYAAAAEYLKLPRDADIRSACLAFQRYIAHPTHGHSPGAYTDDAEMTAANAHVLLEHDPPYTPLMFADAYVDEFRRGGGRKGYARGFQAFLEQVDTGEEFLARIRPDSTKNGAAMRSVPAGVLPEIDQVLTVATTQARITHDTPEGRFSARAVALMSHCALYEDTVPLAELGAYCETHLPREDMRRFGDALRTPWRDAPVTSQKGASVAITTVHAAVDALRRGGSLLEILARIIRWGGDTDSVAAIAWGIAAPRLQEERLPEFMERDLEGGSPRTGVPYLLDLGTRLMAKYE